MQSPKKNNAQKKNEASEEQRFQKLRRPIFTVIGESLSAYLQAVINIARTKKTVNKKIVFFPTNRKKNQCPECRVFKNSERALPADFQFAQMDLARAALVLIRVLRT